MKEINELIYKRKLDEEKLLLLTEGKLNKQQRKSYKNFIKNEKYKSQNNFPFELNYKENEEILEKMKNNCISKDFHFWNVKNKTINNNIEDNKNGFRKNNNKNKIINYDNNAFKPYRNFYNFSSNENTLNYDKINFGKNKNEKTNINIKTKYNEFVSFSPTSCLKKKPFSLSPTNNMEINNKINTESQQKISFSPNHKNEQIIKDILNEKEENTGSIDKEINNEPSKENNKYLYQKKLKKNYNNININLQNNSENFDFKNNEEKYNLNMRPLSNENRYKKDSNYKNSFIELKEIKEITSKMANEIEKKIEIINKKSTISKTKSTPKLNPYVKYKNTHKKTNVSSNGENYKEENNQEANDKNENKKMNKYTKLIKGTKIELSNILNNGIKGDKNERKIVKQKSFMEDFVLPNEIKKECLMELNKTDKNQKGKKVKENMKLNVAISATSREKRHSINKTFEILNKTKNKNKSKNEKKILKKMENCKENRNYNIGNQKIYYKEFLYGSENNTNYLNLNYLSENNSKFLPYSKDIYG